MSATIFVVFIIVFALNHFRPHFSWYEWNCYRYLYYNFAGVYILHGNGYSPATFLEIILPQNRYRYRFTADLYSKSFSYRQGSYFKKLPLPISPVFMYMEDIDHMYCTRTIFLKRAGSGFSPWVRIEMLRIRKPCYPKWL